MAFKMDMSCETPIHMKTISSFLPYPNERLPNHVLIKAKNELGETLEMQRKVLVELKNMLQDCSTTKNIDFEEDFLIHHLRASKYTTEKTFKKLQNYADLKTKHSQAFRGIPDEYFSTRSSVKVLEILPERCPDGCIVYYAQFGKWDPNETSFEDIKALFMLVYLQFFRDPMVQINGVKTIYDFEGTNTRHLQEITLSNMYFFYKVVCQCCPSRVKAVHLVNQTIVLTAAWRFISPFLPKKISKRCHFHSDVSKLLEFFPSSMLPAKYGGDLTDIDSTELFRRLNIEQRNQSTQGQPNFY